MAAQERLLRSVCNLGPRLPRYIRIAASVHTDIDMFVYSQPAIEEGAGESSSDTTPSALMQPATWSPSGAVWCRVGSREVVGF